MGILSGLSLFSGAGGLDIAARWAGIRTVGYVEYDPYAQGVLMSRMRDGSLDPAPIHPDVTTFDGRPWRGRVDCVFGGFPCQDVSIVGKRGGAEDGTRSGLWGQFARIIGEVRPRFVLIENVAGLLSLGFERVLADLARGGYDAEWSCLSAGQVGAPQKRERVWIVADLHGIRWHGLGQDKEVERPGVHFEVPSKWTHIPFDISLPVDEYESDPMPGILRVDDGFEEALDGIRLCGNGVVPQQALPAFEKIVEMMSGPVEGA